MLPRTPLLLIIPLVCVLAVHGQRRVLQPNSPVVTEIRVRGSARFAETELIRVTALRTGEPLSEADMRRGANHLAESGMFNDVSFSYVQTPEGTRLDYRVVDTERLLPVSFDNWVWSSQEQLIEELRQREPLFHGQVSNQGQMFLTIAYYMEEALEHRGIVARVKIMPIAAPNSTATTGFAYAVSGVKLPIAQVAIAGASPAMKAILDRHAAKLRGQDFAVSAIQQFVAAELLPEYRRRGYLRASFAEATGALIEGSRSDVAVTLPVTREGVAYRFGRVDWHGTSAVPPDTLQRAIHLKSGDVADGVRLDEDMKMLAAECSALGYLDAKLEPIAIFNDVAQTADFAVNVVQGPQYRMGALRLEGFSDGAADRIRRQWALHPGSVFNGSYPAEFAARMGGNVSYTDAEIVHHPDTGVADVVLRLVQPQRP